MRDIEAILKTMSKWREQDTFGAERVWSESTGHPARGGRPRLSAIGARLVACLPVGVCLSVQRGRVLHTRHAAPLGRLLRQPSRRRRLKGEIGPK